MQGRDWVTSFVPGSREPEGLCPGAHPLPRGWQTACAPCPAALSPVTARNIQVLLDPERGPPFVILDEGTLSVLTVEERRGLAHTGDWGVGSGHPATWRQAGVPARFARPAPHLSGAVSLSQRCGSPLQPAVSREGRLRPVLGPAMPRCAVSLRLLVHKWSSAAGAAAGDQATRDARSGSAVPHGVQCAPAASQGCLASAVHFHDVSHVGVWSHSESVFGQQHVPGPG